MSSYFYTTSGAHYNFILITNNVGDLAPLKKIDLAATIGHKLISELASRCFGKRLAYCIVIIISNTQSVFNNSISDALCVKQRFFYLNMS